MMMEVKRLAAPGTEQASASKMAWVVSACPLNAQIWQSAGMAWDVRGVQ